MKRELKKMAALFLNRTVLPFFISRKVMFQRMLLQMEFFLDGVHVV